MAECWIWLFRLETFSTVHPFLPSDLMLSVLHSAPFTFSCLWSLPHMDHFPETEMLLLQKNIQHPWCSIDLRELRIWPDDFWNWFVFVVHWNMFSLSLQRSFSKQKTFLCHIKMCVFFLPRIYREHERAKASCPWTSCKDPIVFTRFLYYYYYYYFIFLWLFEP